MSTYPTLEYCKVCNYWAGSNKSDMTAPYDSRCASHKSLQPSLVAFDQKNTEKSGGTNEDFHLTGIDSIIFDSINITYQKE